MSNHVATDTTLHHFGCCLFHQQAASFEYLLQLMATQSEFLGKDEIKANGHDVDFGYADKMAHTSLFCS